MRASAGPSVLHLADYGGAYSGNFVASLRALAEPCRAMGLRVALAFSDVARGRPWIDALRADGFPVHFVARAESLSGRARAIGELAAAEDAALIHTHYTRYDVPAAIATARRRRRAPLVWHVHSPFPPRRPVKSMAKELVKLGLLGRRARIAAVSDAIMRDCIGLGFPKARACTIPNAIDLAHATDARAGRDEVRRQLGVPSAAQVALAFGWQPVRKGIDLALDAVASLAGSGAEGGPVLAVVGTDELQAFLAARFGSALPRWVRFLRPQEHVADLYAAADVFLSSSRSEGFPYALGEALANGLPIVVSDIPGCEWARPVDAARFFPRDDAAALADALAGALRLDPAQREAQARSARAFARAHLSLDAWAIRVAELYREALDDR
jgi:glycosyltransferase involved in cell wall biosynthesis